MSQKIQFAVIIDHIVTWTYLIIDILIESKCIFFSQTTLGKKEMAN